jgi:hypothetical protein
MRSFLLSALVATGIGLLSGCATTSDDADMATKDPTGFETRQPSPTEEMNFMEKTGYYACTARIEPSLPPSSLAAVAGRRRWWNPAV